MKEIKIGYKMLNLAIDFALSCDGKELWFGSLPCSDVDSKEQTKATQMRCAEIEAFIEYFKSNKLDVIIGKRLSQKHPSAYILYGTCGDKNLDISMEPYDVTNNDAATKLSNRIHQIENFFKFAKSDENGKTLTDDFDWK
jgi:hypothetical protein